MGCQVAVKVSVNKAVCSWKHQEAQQLSQGLHLPQDLLAEPSPPVSSSLQKDC